MGKSAIVEMIEGEYGFDEVGLEGADDVVLVELIDDVGPGVASAEEEADEGEVIRVSRRGRLVVLVEAEREEGDVEVEFSGVGEPEFVEGDDGSCVGSDFDESDFGVG